MCNEFRGWCRSFTKTEVLLAALEALLLGICIAFIVFLVGHFIVCRSPHSEDMPLNAGTTCAATDSDWTTNTDGTTTRPDRTTTDRTTDTNNSDETTDVIVTPKPHTTLSPDVECTWMPSYKTDAETQYHVGYRPNHTTTPTRTQSVVKKLHVYVKDEVKSSEVKKRMRGYYPSLNDIDQLTIDDESDGEEAADMYRALILALVRRRSDGSHVFGCVVTAVSEHWAVTCASCIDAVEETDSLDAYVMVERWGASSPTRVHGVSDVSVHPRYGSAPAVHDAAALRSADALLRGARPLSLPQVTDYTLLTIGERLTILGFGPFRSPGKSGPLREAHVYSLGASQCVASDGETWSSKHLSHGVPRPHAACSHGIICAGVMYARGAPCAYCAGTPLVHRRTLLGVAAAAPCGEACDPAPYVNIAALREWLDDLMQPD